MPSGHGITDRDPLLQRLPLFKDADLEAIAPYLWECTERFLDPGEVLIDPREENAHVFLVLDGRFSVRLQSSTDDPLALLRRGDCIGELSVVDGNPPTAWVVAESPARLLAIPAETTWRLVHASHAVAINLLHIVCRRMRTGHAALGESRRDAQIDALTGLQNRRWFELAFQAELRRCRMEACPATLLIADVDHFKRFNDDFGHAAGDRVLKMLAPVLRENLRPQDLCARYGGEEFAMLLPGTRLAEAVRAAERLRERVAALPPGRKGSRTLPSVTLSLGVAEAGPDDGLSELMEKADKALYGAKRAGRNRVHWTEAE